MSSFSVMIISNSQVHSFILLLGAGLLSIVPAANLVPGDIVEVSGYK